MNPDDTSPDTLPSPPLEGFEAAARSDETPWHPEGAPLASHRLASPGDVPKPSSGPTTKPSSPYAIRVEDILKEARRQAGLPETGWDDGDLYLAPEPAPRAGERPEARSAEPPEPRRDDEAPAPSRRKTPLRPDPRREPEE